MINMFKKPKVVIYKDEDGKFKYIAYGQDVEVEFKEIKNTEKKTIEKNIDSVDLEKRLKNLEDLIYVDGEVSLYRDDGNRPIVKRGVPERPTIFPDTESHRWG